jgi:exodeoxyribonuclease V gamma subunit
MLTERREPSSFITHELAQSETEKKMIDVRDLTSFFDNPAKFLLTRSIGLYLEEENAALEDREPFILTGLNKYQFEQRLCERYVAGCDIMQVAPIAAAAGVLPHGTPGDSAVRGAIPHITKFADMVASYMQKEQRTPVEIACECNGFSITGVINDIWPDVSLRYRCAKVKARDRLRIWIQHLVLNASRCDRVPRKSILLGTDYVYEMLPVDGIANKVLGNLIEIYHNGLQRLLHFYPESSLAYAVSIAKGKSRADGLHAARAAWEAGYNAPGEGNDAYYTLCFGGIDTFDQEFEALAQEIYEPLLSNQKQVMR